MLFEQIYSNEDTSRNGYGWCYSKEKKVFEEKSIILPAKLHEVVSEKTIDSWQNSGQCS